MASPEQHKMLCLVHVSGYLTGPYRAGLAYLASPPDRGRSAGNWPSHLARQRPAHDRQPSRSSKILKRLLAGPWRQGLHVTVTSKAARLGADLPRWVRNYFVETAMLFAAGGESGSPEQRRSSPVLRVLGAGAEVSPLRWTCKSTITATLSGGGLRVHRPRSEVGLWRDSRPARPAGPRPHDGRLSAGTAPTGRGAHL